jgi:hypothetical protein
VHHAVQGFGGIVTIVSGRIRRFRWWADGPN